jgi:hypothetical protein
VPGAFLFGLFIENIKSDRLKNTIVFLGVLFIVFFKLFSFEVL